MKPNRRIFFLAEKCDLAVRRNRLLPEVIIIGAATLYIYRRWLNPLLNDSRTLTLTVDPLERTGADAVAELWSKSGLSK